MKDYLDVYNEWQNICGSTPREQYYRNTQELINQSFFNSSTTQTIKHYQKYDDGLSKCTDINVRVVNATNKGQNQTGVSLIDNYKKIIFQDINYNVKLGDIFEFAGFQWICTNTSKIMSITQSCIVHRCNIFLNFYDFDNPKDDELHSIPAIFENRSLNLETEQFILLPFNQYRCIVKYDETSQKIKLKGKPMRFIINHLPYRLKSIDNGTFVYNEEGYIEMILESDTISDYDNTDLNVADYYRKNGNVKTNYLLAIDNGNTANLNLIDSLQLKTTLLKDGKQVNEPLIYMSDNNNICSVDSTGKIIGTGLGIANITVMLASDNTIKSTIAVTVGNVLNNFSVQITSNTGDFKIIKTQTVTFTAVKKNNSSIVEGTFNFTIDYMGLPNNVATLNIVDGNRCKITCNQYDKGYKIKLIATNIENYNLKDEKIIELKSIYG